MLRIITSLFRRNDPLGHILASFHKQTVALEAYIQNREDDLAKAREVIRQANDRVSSCHCDIVKAQKIKTNINQLIEE